MRAKTREARASPDLRRDGEGDTDSSAVDSRRRPSPRRHPHRRPRLRIGLLDLQAGHREATPAKQEELGLVRLILHRNFPHLIVY